MDGTPDFFLTFVPEQQKRQPMTKEKQIDQLSRLVNLISDDSELLSRASTFIQGLVDSKTAAHDKHDLASQLDAQNEKPLPDSSL